MKMITKSSPLCSIVVVLWFGVGFGSKLGSKPARNLARNASKISSKHLELAFVHRRPRPSAAVRRGGGAPGGCRGSGWCGTRWVVSWVRVRVTEERGSERYEEVLIFEF